MNYTSAQVCQAAGITFRQLDYSCRQGSVLAAYMPGSGYKREFTRTQTLRLMILGVLLQRGMLQASAAMIARGWDPLSHDALLNVGPVMITVDTAALRKELDALFPA